MTEFGGKLDEWLERPYVEQAERDADFERFCDENNLDSGDEASVEAWIAQDVPDGPDPDDEADRQRENHLDGGFLW